MTTKITNVQDLAVERLPSQFQGKPKLEAFIRIITAHDQTAEDCLWQMFTERSLDEAAGAQLDVVGSIVGEARQGKIDVDYRRFIRAAIKTNKSNGTGEQLIEIAGLVLNLDDAVIRIKRRSVASLVIQIDDVTIEDALAAVLLRFLTRAASAVARLILETQNEDIDRAFIWGTSLWSDDTDLQPTTDDLWNDVREMS